MYSWQNKKVLVLGSGISGIGAAKVLHALGAQVLLNDAQKKGQEEDIYRSLGTRDIQLALGTDDTSLLDTIELVIISPGIPLTVPFVEDIKRRGIPLWGEVELAYRVSPVPILGVTGTNGKTTTTMLLKTVLEADQKKVVMGGNIGTSLSEAAYHAKGKDYLVAELSSYQLETIDSFAPLGAIFLNVAPDHLARHKTMDAYVQAKSRIFENQGPHQWAVLNKDDATVYGLRQSINSHICLFSMKEPIENGAFYKEGYLYVARDGKAEELLKKEDIQLIGDHNIDNILSVMALGNALGLSPKAMIEGITSFQPVPHRMELVGTFHDITFINDSKGTNCDSVKKAILALEPPITLILGGYDKGEDLTEFMHFLKDKTERIIFTGKSGPRFYEAAKKEGLQELFIEEELAESLQVAIEHTKAGETILFSPACSSFDYYRSFEERGDAFKVLVLDMVHSIGKEV